MEPLLRVEKASKKFSRDLKASFRTGARSLLRSYLPSDENTQTPLEAEELWALKDVSFELRRGDVLAILGQNGAGKSTLLKSIAGKLQLDAGKIELHGQIGHLLEMSAGFDPTLTGRENVQLRGRLMNLRGAQLADYVSQVAEFAELDEFFDSPVQFYSSGMKARLGFSASSVMTPDILILDEVLAVGDLSFRLKCYERINVMSRNAAVLFVSHSLGQAARMCNRGMYLERGRVLIDGAAQEAIAMYQDKLGQGNERAKRTVLHPELVDIVLKASGRRITAGEKIAYGEPLAVEIDTSRIPPRAQLRILLQDAVAGLVTDWNSARSPFPWDRHPPRIIADLGAAELNPGAYSIALHVASEDGREHLCVSTATPFRVVGDLHYAAAIQRRASWSSGDEIDNESRVQKGGTHV
jgi:lipopolysaccharide transport system ATP-binding protein